jgi:two-component system, LuxR family, response regulator FixJ
VKQSEPTVYVVDDDADVLRSLTRLLRASGYRVEPFSSATEFLRQAACFGLGCAIVDLHMTEMSGLSLQDCLLQAGITLPLIFLTGSGDFQSSVQAVKRGAMDYLAKPVEAMNLLPAIDAAIQKHATLMAG